MPCEQYKDALSEAAASGAAPRGELRAHLAECALCRAAFVQEQSLFGAIDSGLRSAVNAEVPPSLLPRVRAGLDEAVLARPRWFVSWPVLAGMAVCALILIAIVFRENNAPSHPETPVASQSSTPQPEVPPSATSPSETSLRPKPNVPAPVSVAKNEAPRLPSDSRNASLEVLVPRDQELLLASYAEQWSARRRAPLIARNLDDTTVAPLEVAPIQIDQLDVKLLAEEKSQ